MPPQAPQRQVLNNSAQPPKNPLKIAPQLTPTRFNSQVYRAAPVANFHALRATAKKMAKPRQKDVDGVTAIGAI